MSLKSFIKLNQDLKSLYIKTAKKLKGSDRRQFMAEVVKGLGIGGQTLAEKELGWNRRTIRKGMQELESGVAIVDGYHRSGRKRVEVRLPNLLRDIQSIVDPQSQTDPSFKSTRLYTRITTSEVHRQLTEQINDTADNDPYTLRISMDAKVALKVGEFDRGGKTRMPTHSLDHDFSSEATLIPYGIFVPRYNELFLFFVTSTLTADCIVDVLQDWWQTVKHRFHQIKTLVINQDNGPENNSRRTQFMKRIVDFSTSSQLNLQLAYYPPYHSKYNPIERCFGWLEQHWNGSLLDTVETVLKFAQNLSFKGKNPVVKLIDKVYSKGVKLTKLGMDEIESCISRLPNLKKWFVKIFPQSL
jgi:transposase